MNNSDDYNGYRQFVRHSASSYVRRSLCFWPPRYSATLVSASIFNEFTTAAISAHGPCRASPSLVLDPMALWVALACPRGLLFPPPVALSTVALAVESTVVCPPTYRLLCLLPLCQFLVSSAPAGNLLGPRPTLDEGDPQLA